ncbi:winged helix DNA-binding domain-containing protein [Microbacterium aurum]
MDLERLRDDRLRAHRLSDPADDVIAAATHLTATQAQEFWGGRWALGVRAAGEPTLREVDAAFDDGLLVRSGTQRGTLHIVRPADLGWILSLTEERQMRQHAAIFRDLGIDDALLARAEATARAALRGGNRLTRTEFGEVLAAAGIDSGGMRGSRVVSALSLRAVLVWGPVVHRQDAPSREQYLVLADEWITDAAAPPDPLAELFVRYLRGHGPAGIADFRWWAGLPLGVARAARERAGDRVAEVDDGLFAEVDDGLFVEAAVAQAPPDPSTSPLPTPSVLALPGWDEYFLSYADRAYSCPPERLADVGPTLNGLVRPVLVERGEVIGTWTHSMAVGRHHLDPTPALFSPGADAESVADALARFAAFVRA